MLNVKIIHVDIPCSLTAFEDMIGWYKHDVCRQGSPGSGEVTALLIIITPLVLSRSRCVSQSCYVRSREQPNLVFCIYGPF